jgi:SAM-dependent methyltransferase
MRDVRAHNQVAWDRCVERKNRWTIPCDDAEIAHARLGYPRIVLTPTKPVPASWLGNLRDVSILCLASGGGQQAPLLAAAGARVTSLDNSPKQLEQDRLVADRHHLSLTCVRGDMADLTFADDSQFDLVFHPCSNTFVPHVRPVWEECFRVLRPGGTLLTGFCNPVLFLFDDPENGRGDLTAKHSIPYSDLDHLDDPHIRHLVESGEPVAFGHTLEDQIGGQTDAGFHLIGFYEDRYAEEENDPLSRLLATFIATRALKC